MRDKTWTETALAPLMPLAVMAVAVVVASGENVVARVLSRAGSAVCDSVEAGGGQVGDDLTVAKAMAACSCALQTRQDDVLELARAVRQLA
jgi:hypothetical protein